MRVTICRQTHCKIRFRNDAVNVVFLTHDLHPSFILPSLTRFQMQLEMCANNCDDVAGCHRRLRDSLAKDRCISECSDYVH